jgi:hypothetical protein
MSLMSLSSMGVFFACGACLLGFGCFDEDDDLVMFTASRYGCGAAFSFLGLGHLMAWFGCFIPLCPVQCRVGIAGQHAKMYWSLDERQGWQGKGRVSVSSWLSHNTLCLLLDTIIVSNLSIDVDLCNRDKLIRVTVVHLINYSILRSSLSFSDGIGSPSTNTVSNTTILYSSASTSVPVHDHIEATIPYGTLFNIALTPPRLLL